MLTVHARMALALGALCSSLACGLPVHAGSPVCEAEILGASARHGVPAGILFAIGLTETGNGGSMQPYALNVEGEPHFAESAADAERLIQEALAQGHTLIDVGCMQVNLRWHRSAFVSLRDMLQPAANVDYAAGLLAELYSRFGSWTLAAARYHAGPDNEPAQQRYVCTVLRNLIATGFGGETAAGGDLCGR